MSVGKFVWESLFSGTFLGGSVFRRRLCFVECVGYILSSFPICVRLTSYMRMLSC